MRPMRVLVCGSNYGRVYITALRQEPRKYELAGILARGSARSQRVAALNGIPLYRSTDELPDNIDLACTAMSSTAWPLVLQLLRRRINVLCEHPYAAGKLKQALALASKHNVQFHVNGHFASLPAPQAFVRECRHIAKAAGPEFVEAMATERSLYGALDILASAAGRVSQPRFHVLSRRAGFVLLEGTIGKLPVRLTVQVSGKKGSGRLADGSPAYLLDLRLTMAFPTGLLTLLSVDWSGGLDQRPRTGVGKQRSVIHDLPSREADAGRAGRAKDPGERRGAELNWQRHSRTWCAGEHSSRSIFCGSARLGSTSGGNFIALNLTSFRVPVAMQSHAVFPSQPLEPTPPAKD